MSDAKKCDICGKFYESNKNVCINKEPIETLRYISHSYNKTQDLCDDCLNFYFYQVPNILAEARNGSKNAKTIINAILDFDQTLNYQNELVKELFL